ncbi:MAG: hypothetical protein M3275_00245 [Thermoproteota archaeon]|nr:hypothetical protein [Thermoproteota archaeon]
MRRRLIIIHLLLMLAVLTYILETNQTARMFPLVVIPPPAAIAAFLPPIETAQLWKENSSKYLGYLLSLYGKHIL